MKKGLKFFIFICTILWSILLLVSNVNSVTLFEDDFNSGSLNTSYWTQIGSFCSVTGGVLLCTGDTGTAWEHSVTGLGYLLSNYDNITMEFSTRVDLNSLNQGMIGLGDNGGASFTNGDLLVYMSDTDTANGYTNGNTNTIFSHNNLSAENWYNFKMATDGTNNYFWYKPNSSSTWYFAGNGSFTTAATLYPFIAYKRGDVYFDDFIIYSDGSKTEPVAPNTITTSLLNAYNTTTINFQMNTTLNSNMSYSLNSSSNVSICNNCTIGNVTLNSLFESLYILDLYAISGTNAYLQQNFTIDLTIPSLNVTNNTESSSYNVDFSQIINYTPGDTCNITTDEFLTFSCDNNSYNFITNGNHSFNVTVSDIAGNSVSSLNNLVLINPFLRFNFQTPSSTPITNYTFNGVSFTDTASFKLYDLVSSVPQNVTLLFQKLGYTDTNITIEVNDTSDFNTTFDITLARIIINILDRETSNPIQNKPATVTLIGAIGLNGTTTTGQLNFTSINLLAGDYHIISELPGYDTEETYFSFTNQETVTLNVYLLNSTASDAGSITIIAKDSFSQFIQGVTCEARQWVPSESAYVKRSEGLTNSEGESILNIEIGTKEYKFFCSIVSNGVTYSATSSAEVVKVDLDSRTLILDTATTPTIAALSGLTSTITEVIVGNISNITITYTDSRSEVTQVCVTYYDVTNINWEQLGQDCSIGNSGEAFASFYINNSYPLTVLITAETSLNTYNLGLFKYASTTNLESVLDNYGLSVFIPLFLILAGIGLGLVLENIYILTISIPIMSWLGFIIVPNIVTGSMASVITIFSLIMLWAGYEKK